MLLDAGFKFPLMSMWDFLFRQTAAKNCWVSPYILRTNHILSQAIVPLCCQHSLAITPQRILWILQTSTCNAHRTVSWPEIWAILKAKRLCSERWELKGAPVQPRQQASLSRTCSLPRPVKNSARWMDYPWDLKPEKFSSFLGEGGHLPCHQNSITPVTLDRDTCLWEVLRIDVRASGMTLHNWGLLLLTQQCDNQSRDQAELILSNQLLFLFCWRDKGRGRQWASPSCWH